MVAALSAYLTHRAALRPFLPDEDPSSDPVLLAQLTEDERRARDEARAARAAEALKAKEEEAAQEAERVAAMDELARVQHAVERRLAERGQEMLERIKVKRVSKEVKAEMYKAIRYSHL